MSSRLLHILVDSFPKLLIPGLTVTIPLTAIAFTLAMVKDTSLAANITVVEMFRAAEQINATFYEPLALCVEAGLIYLLFSTVLTWVQRAGGAEAGGNARLRGGRVQRPAGRAGSPAV